MKRWRFLVAMIVFCLALAAMPGNLAKAETQETANAVTAASVTAYDILGVWQGYYMGYSGSTEIRRGFTLNIVSCDSSNFVYGVASVKPYGISSGDTIHYYFEGSFDPATLTLKFCGKNIIQGTTSSFSLSEFTAVFDPVKQELNGSMTDSKDRTLYLAREATNNKITKEILQDSWTGDYMGFRGEDKVKRIITFDIKSVKDDNTLSGVAKVEGIPDEIDQVELKYNFSGFYNLTTGQVIIRGTDFVTENSDTENFSFVYFFGTVNPETGEISGIDGIEDTSSSLTDIKFNVYNDIYVMDEGTSFTYKNGNYEVLTNDETKTVAYIGPKDKTVTQVSIPSSVTAFGVNYKITGIADNALTDCTSLTKVVIGDNVSTVGENAFNNCSSLKSVTFKSKSIKQIGDNAFAGIYEKAVFNVPKDKYSTYTKWLKKAAVGYVKTWSIRKK